MIKKSSHNQTPDPNSVGQRHRLTVAEVARFLKRLSNLYRDPTTGNPALSEALAELAIALRRHSNRSLSEAVKQAVAGSDQEELEGISRFKELELDDVKRIISDGNVRKVVLVTLANERFGIPRSTLMRLNTQQVVEEILSAVRHEESLDIISKEAKRSGTERS